MRRATSALLLALLALPAAAQGPAFGAPLLDGWDDDGVPLPYDRCPDRGAPRRVDDAGCPLAASGRWGDLDRDGLVNGRGATMRAGTPLAVALQASGIVHGRTLDGRLHFFGEEEHGTDPRDPNSDRLDLLADGYEVALARGLTPAARPLGYGASVVQPDDVPLADPRAIDDYLEVRPAIVGTTTYWNRALEEALRRVVADDLDAEANATYRPPPVRLHAWVEPSVALADGTLEVDEVPTEVRQHLGAARAPFVTYVLVVPAVEWEGHEQAGLAFSDVVVVAVEHKGFHRCEEEGGAPGTPACDDLMRLFRWTLNHERFHRFGLRDTVGGDDLMSTAPDVHAPRPHESRARFEWLEREQAERLVREWRR